MTTNDPFDGLHGPRRSAPSGGADRAIAAGRRRIVRRRTAGTAAGLSVAMLAGTFAGLRDGDRQGLDPTGQPTGLPVATGTPSLPAVPVSPSAPPLATLFPTATPSSAPEPAEPSAEPTETPARGRFIGVSPRTVQTTTSNDPAACTAQPDQSAYTAQTGFCTILTAPTQVRPGQAVTFSFALCRPGGMAARTVTWESDYEVSFDVASQGARDDVERWAWAHAEDFAPRRHTVTFNPGDCRTWRVTWRGQDNDGYALAPGSYQVNGYAPAYDWTHEDGDDPMGPPPQFQPIEVTR